MTIADNMATMVEKASMIRKMFEEGAKLKAIHGEKNVFDFSLGNPDVPPPPEFKKVLRELVNDDSLTHGYTPSPGYPHVRQAVAEYLGGEHGIEFRAELVIMTVGAAGALNDILKALINPGEQVLTPSPSFVGYNQYCFVAGASLQTAPCDAAFHLDLAAIDAAINESTRIFLINSLRGPSIPPKNWPD